MLNDIEVIGDKIFVNIYLTTKIAELELKTGKFIRYFLLKGINKFIIGRMISVN